MDLERFVALLTILIRILVVLCQLFHEQLAFIEKKCDRKGRHSIQVNFSKPGPIMRLRQLNVVNRHYRSITCF